MAELQETIKALDEKNPNDLLRVAEIFLRLENQTKALHYLRRARKRATNSDQIAAIDERITKLGF